MILEQGTVINLAQDALKVVIYVAAPMLLISIIVGLTISIFQATTQVHEQTLTFVPKILAVLVAVVVFGPWMLRILTEFTQNLYMNINLYIK